MGGLCYAALDGGLKRSVGGIFLLCSITPKQKLRNESRAKLHLPNSSQLLKHAVPRANGLEAARYPGALVPTVSLPALPIFLPDAIKKF